MDQYHHSLNSLCPDLRDQCVDGIGLVVELQPCHTGRRHDRGCALQRHADEGHLVAQEVLHTDTRKQRRAAADVLYIGREEFEVGTAKRAIVQVCRQTQPGERVGRVVAAVLHAQQLGLAFVELMVADGVEVDTDPVHGFDRGLVLEQCRREWAGTDHVASGHHRMQAVGGFQLLDLGGETCHTRVAGRTFARFDVTMKVVEADQLDRKGGAYPRLQRGRHQPAAFCGRDLALLEQVEAHLGGMCQEGGLVTPRLLVADQVVDRAGTGDGAVAHAAVKSAELHGWRWIGHRAVRLSHGGHKGGRQQRGKKCLLNHYKNSRVG